MTRDEGVVVVSTPEKVLSFTGRKALGNYLRNHPGTVIQAAKAIHRGVVEDVTEDYLGRADLGSYLAGAAAIGKSLTDTQRGLLREELDRNAPGLRHLASAESAQGDKSAD